MQGEGMTYAATGVDYDDMDPVKRKGQIAGRRTAGNIKRLGLEEVEWSRGESVHLIEYPEFYIGDVVEGLGTKNVVADAMFELTGVCYYEESAMDAIGCIVNDLCTLGCRPVSVNPHIAAANSIWFTDETRIDAFTAGWEKGCNLARCVWGGGETPALRDVIVPGTAEISGSGYGIIKPKSMLINPDNIQNGDTIVTIGSSGIHANGITLCRDLATRLPKGYLTEIPGGQTFGEAIMTPTILYPALIEDCQEAGVDIHYAVNITGHGWRKLMRASKPFNYVIERLPEPQPIFRFIWEMGRVDIKEMYGNYNMGAGFALFIAKSDLRVVRQVAENLGMTVLNAGHIIAGVGEKQVIIEPLDIEFKGSTLQVR